jgi:PTS system galactitol-specific IIA component
MDIVNKDLIAYGLDAADSEDAIRQAAALLEKGGYVKDTYVGAVLEREKTYPTGLHLDGIDIAMPHTMPEHVNKAAMCIVKLRNPVRFQHMAEPEIDVDAAMLFMMAIEDPKEQLSNLKTIMRMFTNQEAVSAFVRAASHEELVAAAEAYLK